MAFYGGIANRDLRFGFTCEFCGKEAEIKTTLTEKNGEYHKASSTVIGRPGTASDLVLGARYLMQERVNKIDRDWEKGKFDAPEEADGICPYCHKYQSWSKNVQEAQKGKNWFFSLIVSPIIAELIMSVILGGIIAFVLSFLIVTFWESAPGYLTDPFPMMLIFAALYAVYAITGIMVKGIRIAVSVKALKKTDIRNKPRFIAWEGDIRVKSSGHIQEKI